MHIYKILLCSIFISNFTHTMMEKSSIYISPESTLDDVIGKWHLSQEDFYGDMPLGSFHLFKACETNNHELVKDLLHIGIDPDVQDDYDHTPLQYSMTPDKMRPEIAALLIQFGADYNYRRKAFVDEKPIFVDEKPIIDTWSPDYRKQVFIIVRYNTMFNYIKNRERK